SATHHCPSHDAHGPLHYKLVQLAIRRPPVSLRHGGRLGSVAAPIRHELDVSDLASRARMGVADVTAPDEADANGHAPDAFPRVSPSHSPWRYMAPSARSYRPYPGRPRSPQ